MLFDFQKRADSTLFLQHFGLAVKRSDSDTHTLLNPIVCENSRILYFERHTVHNAGYSADNQ